MKNVLLHLVIMLISLMMLVSCGTTYDTLTQQTPTVHVNEYVNEEEQEPDAEIADEMATGNIDAIYDDPTQQVLVGYANEAEEEPDLKITSEIATERTDMIYDTQPQEKLAGYTSESIGEPNVEITSGIAVEGMITGDVLFNDEIAISRLFIEPVFDVLGQPWGEHDNFFFFDGGLSITIAWGYVASQIDVGASDLNRLSIGGITFDMNRADLINALGNPIQYYDNPDVSFTARGDARMIFYEVLSHYTNHIVVFSFENTNDRTEVTSVAIVQASQ